MIRYSLACDGGHEFEGWFASSSDYDAQLGRSLVSCPVCGSQKVSKLLMAPAVSTSRRKSRIEASKADQLSAAPESTDAVQGVAAMTPEQMELVSQLRELKNKLLSTAENVGEDFSEEARKIHYGEATRRSIYGKASLADAKELIEDGIVVVALPDLPEDRN
ncbi:MAG: DUF1178 family protein [Rhizobiaceae bacterium]